MAERGGADGAKRWNFGDIFSVVAREIPDAPALIQGDRRVIWSNLDRRATSLAACLVDAGLGHQAKVAQYLFSTPEYIESVLACFKGGFVPVNTNYRYGPDELTYLWSNADAAAVVFHGTFADTIAAMRQRVPQVAVWLWVDDGSGACPDWATPYETAAAREAGSDWRPWETGGDDIVLLYTGGTTGAPKGVMWRQEDLVIRINTESGAPFPEFPDTDYLRSKISRNGRAHLPAAPLMHGAGLLTCFMTLSRGGAISHLAERSFSARDLLDTAERDSVASIMWVGDAFAKPVLDELNAHPGRWALPSLRTIISSGVIFSAEVKKGILEHLPGAVIVDVFGASEVLSFGRSMTTREAGTSTATFEAKGRTRVITEDGRSVTPGSGELGFIAFAGRHPVGYYKDPGKTAAIFRTVNGERLVVPGDMATVAADGTITLIGRGSDCINTGGEKVFPAEVEIALKRHEAVNDAVVIGIADDRFGQAVAAVVELKGGTVITDEDLKAYVRSQLARYKSPRHVRLIDKIVRMPSGKPDLAAARALFAEA